MLSSTLNLIGTGPVDAGKHPLVTQLLKAIYQTKPPEPRYNNIWDPSILLRHLRNNSPIPLSLIQLSRKTVTLLAVTTLLRCSELCSIKCDSIVFSTSSVSLQLGTLRKSRRSGPLKIVTLDAWPADSTICPVSCLHTYLQQTETIRKTSRATCLFACTTLPHKTASSSTLGRWIKVQLREAGVNTDIFCAHSTRSAASSKAAAAGVSVQTILNQGHCVTPSPEHEC